LTREDRQAQTRERLIRAAHDVFVRRGFHAATLEEIAMEAGVTKGAVYSNFESKVDLFLTVYDSRMDERVRGYEVAGSTVHELEELAREHARVMSSDDPDGRWASVVVEASAVAASDERLRAALIERVHHANRIVSSMIDELAARANVEFPYPPMQVAQIGGAILRGLLLQRLLDPDRMPTELLQEAFAAFVRGLARPIDAAAARERQQLRGAKR